FCSQPLVDTRGTFLCSICLDVFTDPVSIPCGHNFCKSCITHHWDVNARVSVHCVQRFLTGDLSFTSTRSYQRWLLSSDSLCKEKQQNVKRDKLVKLDAEIQQKIQKRRLKIEKIRQSVKLSREDTDRETAASMEVFTALIRSVEEGLAQLLDFLEEEHNKTEKQAEGFIKELEDEISELMKRSAEVEQLLSTEDHLQFLQNLPSLNPAPPTHIWTEVRVHSSHEGTVRSAVAQLAGTLSEKMRKMCADVELKRVQQYAVDVTLDPDTASPYLILSDDQKRVKSVETQQILPDYPQRFTTCNGVLGKQSFSSGRSYYEVLVKEKTDWDVGVAGESIIRKGKVRLSPKNGFWTVWLRNGKDYKALAGPGVLLFLKSKPQKVGVFVDYEGGVVSFYDADAAALIYSFTGCNFNEKLYPYFSPCSVCADVLL
uniref:B30.2/SPRY domain-containing protein n=1 Tax=Labrus bergylta TaxID=56723 RepID=A0A3Q3GC45_9LABR